MFRKLMYKLKKHFGGKCDLYQVTSKTVDRITGVVTIAKVKYTLRKAIVSPSEMRINAYNHADFKVGDRELWFWKGEVTSTFVPSMKDYIVIEGIPYYTVDFTIIDADGYYYHVRRMQEQDIQEIFEVTLNQGFALDESTGGTI